MLLNKILYTKGVISIMKANKIISFLLVLVIILAVVTACGDNEKKQGFGKIVNNAGEGENTEEETTATVEVTEEIVMIDPPEPTDPEPVTISSETESPETVAGASEITGTDTEPMGQTPGGDNGETVSALSAEEAAEIGQWVTTKKNGKDMELGDIRYRIISVTDDQAAIMTEIESYNADDNNFLKVETEIPENSSLRLCQYELVYEDGFPSYGDDNTIYSPSLNLSVSSADGGGLETTDGIYIGLMPVDISPKSDPIKIGEVFTGKVVYAIPDNLVEQYYLKNYYSDKDEAGNPKSVYTYVLPEVINSN